MIASASPVIRTVVRPRLPVDLRHTLGPLRRGVGDPTIRRAPGGAWWRASRTPAGPATCRFERHPHGVTVLAWGPGSDWAVANAPELLGGRDDVEGFDPPGGVVRELYRRMQGLRITRSLAVFEAAVPSVLEQKVPGRQARDSYRALVRRYGEPAPGPARLVLPPAPEALRGLSYADLHPFGVEMKRANVILRLALDARRVDEATGMPLGDAYRRLRAFPGVGAWTAAEVAIVALGDADAVSIGDYHLPHLVSWALAGEPRGSDERMLELLEPFAGHRGRVLRLLTAAGLQAPRFGPRMALQPFERM